MEILLRKLDLIFLKRKNMIVQSNTLLCEYSSLLAIAELMKTGCTLSTDHHYISQIWPKYMKQIQFYMNSPLNSSDSDSVALFCVFSSYINTLLLRKKNYTKTRNFYVFCLHINICSSVFGNYSIDYCYLFGSYAKGKATEVSDVDLLISTLFL